VQFVEGHMHSIQAKSGNSWSFFFFFFFLNKIFFLHWFLFLLRQLKKRGRRVRVWKDKWEENKGMDQEKSSPACCYFTFNQTGLDFYFYFLTHLFICSVFLIDTHHVQIKGIAWISSKVNKNMLGNQWQRFFFPLFLWLLVIISHLFFLSHDNLNWYGLSVGEPIPWCPHTAFRVM